MGSCGSEANHPDADVDRDDYEYDTVPQESPTDTVWLDKTNPSDTVKEASNDAVEKKAAGAPEISGNASGDKKFIESVGNDMKNDMKKFVEPSDNKELQPELVGNLGALADFIKERTATPAAGESMEPTPQFNTKRRNSTELKKPFVVDFENDPTTPLPSNGKKKAPDSIRSKEVDPNKGLSKVDKLIANSLPSDANIVQNDVVVAAAREDNPKWMNGQKENSNAINDLKELLMSGQRKPAEKKVSEDKPKSASRWASLDDASTTAMNNYSTKPRTSLKKSELCQKDSRNILLPYVSAETLEDWVEWLYKTTKHALISFSSLIIVHGPALAAIALLGVLLYLLSIAVPVVIVLGLVGKTAYGRFYKNVEGKTEDDAPASPVFQATRSGAMTPEDILCQQQKTP